MFPTLFYTRKWLSEDAPMNDHFSCCLNNVVTGSDTTADQKLGYCFIPSTCLAFGVNYMFSSTTVAIGVDLLPAAATPFPVPSPNFCSLLMISWGLIYYVLGWYLEHVIPQKHGTARHPLFPCYAMCKLLNRLSSCCRSSVSKEDLADEAAIQQKKKVTVQGLNKVFRVKGLEGGKRAAVVDLSLEVNAGEILVLLGPNGAGKSTTFNMLTGMMPPTSGDISVFGLPLRTCKDQIRSFMGYVPQSSISYPQLTVKQNIQLISRLQGIPFDISAHQELLTELDIFKQLNVRAGELSGGQRRKLDLCMALSGDTKVLFLDEVSTGVDPSSRKEIWNVLRKQRHGKVIVCTTHFLDEADYLADKIAILDRGKLCCYGAPLELKARYGGNGYTLSVFAIGQMGCHRQAIAEAVLSWFPAASQLPTHSTNIYTFRVPFQTNDAAAFSSLLETLEKMEGEFSINLELPSLEDVFLRIIRDSRMNDRKAVDAKSDIVEQQPGERLTAAKVSTSRCKVLRVGWRERRLLPLANVCCTGDAPQEVHAHRAQRRDMDLAVLRILALRLASHFYWRGFHSRLLQLQPAKPDSR